MTTREWVRKNIGRYKTKTSLVKACMEESNCTRGVVYRVLRQEFGSNYKSSEDKVASGNIGDRAMSVEEFRKQYDYNYKIQRAVDNLPKDKVFVEADFREIAKVPVSHFRRYAERSEFDEYRGKAGGKVYWGNKETIGQLKDEELLQ